MKIYSSLDVIKDEFQDIIKQKSSHSIDPDEYCIDYNSSLENVLNKKLDLLKFQLGLLERAHKSDDELAMQSALLKIRTHAISLSGFFEAIADDTELVLRTGEWPNIPENYTVPEQYFPTSDE